MPSCVTQPPRDSAPTLTAEPNRNDRRSSSPDRGPSTTASSREPAPAFPAFTIMTSDFPHALLPDEAYKHAPAERILAGPKLPPQGLDRQARAFAAGRCSAATRLGRVTAVWPGERAARGATC